MAGKSTFIRQNALIVILAQAGSFVPADSAEIGIVDRVFSRVGARDELDRDRSTFFIEMDECTSILKTATDRSLVSFSSSWVFTRMLNPPFARPGTVRRAGSRDVAA